MKKDFSSMIENASFDEIDAILQSDVKIDGDVSSDNIRKKVKGKMNAGVFAKLRTSLAVSASLLLVTAIGVASVVYMVGQKTVDPPDYTDSSGISSVYTEITTEGGTSEYTTPSEVTSTAMPTETIATATLPSEDVMTGVTTDTVPTATTETTATEHQPIYDLVSYEKEQAESKTNYRIGRNSYKYYSSLIRYENGEEIWQVNFPDLYLEQYLELYDGVLLSLKPYDDTPYFNETSEYYIAKIDFGGNLCWKYEMTHLRYLDSVDVNYLYEYNDGTFAVLSGTYYSIFDESRSDVGISHYSHDGELLSYKNNHLRYLFIYDSITFTPPMGTEKNEKVIRLENGFLIADLGDYFDTYAMRRIQRTPETQFLFMDDDGNITLHSTLKYPELDGVANIDVLNFDTTSVIEYRGKIYVAGYYYDSSQDSGLTDEEMTSYKIGETDFTVENPFGLAMRKKQIGFILSCDHDGGNVEVFFSERGWQGGKLRIDDDGNLVWEAERIVSWYRFKDNDPSIGASKIFEFAFNAEGNMINITETDKYKRIRS